VTLLAVLELYKRGLAYVAQDTLFGDIVITHLSAEEAARRGIHRHEEDDE
jgi:chromatin segregation and condensation protein Rec8/ScpA/Scc1 (kleisin family)